MGAAVHLPLRVVIDPRSASADRDEIAARTGAALSRALARSATAVREVRHGRRLRMTPPAFTWTGEALGALDGEARDRLEAAVEAAISASVSGALSTGDPRQDLPDPGGTASETARPDRYDAANRLYDMPSHGSDGAKVAVPVIPDGEASDGETSEDEDSDTFSTEDDPLRELIARKFRRLTRSQLFAAARRFRRDPAHASFFEVPMWGVAYQDETGTASLAVWETGEDVDRLVIGLRINRLFEVGLDASGPGPRPTPRPIELSAIEDLKVRYFASGPADEVMPRLREHYARLFSDLRRDVLGAAALNFTQDEIAAQTAGDVESTLGDLGPEPGAEIHLVELTMGGRSFIIETDVAPPRDLGAHLFALTEIDLTRVPGGETSGREDGAGAGSRGRGRGEGRSPGDGLRKRRGRAGSGGAEAGGGGQPDGGPSDGTGEGAPGFILGPAELLGDPEGARGSSFPLAVAGADMVTLTCEPFEGEASLEALGAEGAALRVQMRRIAFLLQIPVCDYPARFCINAMVAIEARAWGVSAASRPENDLGFTAPVPSGANGNLGPVDFTPIPSPAIQLLRQCARTVPMISAMSQDINALYMRGGKDALLGGWLKGKGTAWALRFGIELSDAGKQSLGIHFMTACQVLLLQLLRRSRREIDRRLDNFDIYGPLFLDVLRSQLTDVATYERLRERLDAPPLAAGAGAAPVGSADWTAAARAWADTLETAAAPPAAREGEVIAVGGERMVHDANGRLWSREMLERAILLRRGGAEDIDPLIKQLTEVPEIVARLKGAPDQVLTEIRDLLREMRRNNAEMQASAARDIRFAFRAAPIHESLDGATVPGTALALRGVHLLAHERVGGFFGGSAFYPAALDRLFGAELGLGSLKEFFQTMGVLTLSIVCPPAGVALDRVLASVEMADAKESERLFESLIDPELVIARGEVEARLFAARLGLAFAFVPGVGRLLKTGRQALRVGSRAGARMALASASRRITRQVTHETAAALARSLPQVFIEEVVVDQAMDLLLGRLVEGIVADIAREARLTGSVGGSVGAAGSIEALGLVARPAPSGEGGR